MEGLETDVTVTVTRDTVSWGVLVMLKLVVAPDVVFVSLKNAVLPDTSGRALTSIFTPCGGILELMVTASGKFGPGATASCWPLMAGLVVITRFSSAGSTGSPPPLSLQEGSDNNEIPEAIKIAIKLFFIIRC